MSRNIIRQSRRHLFFVLGGALLPFVSPAGAEEDLTSRFLHNEAAYIPPQCYTKTIDDQNRDHNPCYSCHIPSRYPNLINDGDLQLSYSFAAHAETNHWRNLFEDRSARVAAIDDETILAYVRTDNYRQGDRLVLADKLAQTPEGWDYDKDGQWDGYMPDCWFDFDSEGFDRTPDGRLTGWRAFGYYPFLGTFWPTNGSTDDVLIRLAPSLRQDENGQPDREIYKVNLAIVEAVVRRRDVPIEAVDETRLKVDLDKDGQLGQATQITYDWAPLEGRTMSYVGKARLAQEAGTLHLAGGLFPEGTEFLHSVRYIDVTPDGEISLAPRMKELRYAVKKSWQTYGQLQNTFLNEAKEKDDFPDRLRTVFGNMERGVQNGQGWTYQGFIEDADGALRPQTFEENVFCVGCHGGVGATTDGIFSFPRRFGAEAFQGGWYHWSQRPGGLKGIPEPMRSDGRHEYSFYLEQNGAGDEFRSNDEVMDKFFTDEGTLRPDPLKALHEDIAVLLLPSRQRALTLNKAYRVIVEDQDFIDGRDATVTPPQNVHQSVTLDQPTGVETILEGPDPR